MRRRVLVGIASICVLLTCAELALAENLTVPIPGLAGPAIELAGALRTNDGGAVLAARILDGRRSARGRAMTARLLADGALNLAYGSEGLSILRVDSRLQLTTLAIDPASGDAWIGARLGLGGSGEIIAVDGRGHLRRGFGQRGVLRLPAVDNGGPAALAWRPRALFIAAGDSACRGCSLSIRDPSTGALRATNTLASTDLAPAPCRWTAVTSAVFASGPNELVATRTAGGSGCAASVLTLDVNLKPTAASGSPAPGAGGQATAMVISGSQTGSCLAASDPARILLAPYPPALSGAGATAPRGTLLGVVALGSGSCAALIRAPGGRATVAQMSSGNQRAVVDRLPASIAPLTMFRCYQHLLVVGAVKRGRGQAAVVAPVPVRRGRLATRASAAGLTTASTGCQRP